MTQEQSVIDHFSGLIVDLQKRLYALEREVREMKVVRKSARRPK